MLLGQLIGRQIDARRGVVDQDVQSTECLPNLREQASDSLRLPKVSPDAQAPNAVGLDRSLSLGCLVMPPQIVERDVDAPARQFQRDCPAYAASAARNERGLAP